MLSCNTQNELGIACCQYAMCCHVSANACWQRYVKATSPVCLGLAWQSSAWSPLNVRVCLRCRVTSPEYMGNVAVQVPDEDLVDRVAGRRLDPETGDIYHMKHKPPPEDIKDRLIQRSDDTAEKVKTRLNSHHSNVDAVLGYYQDILVEVRVSTSEP